MQTSNDTRQNHKPIKAIILCVIGVLGSFKLIISGIIGEASFISLIFLTVASSFLVYFANRLKSFSIGKVKATMDSMVAKQIEPKSITPKQTIPLMSVEAYGTDDDAKSVIKAIGKTQYTWRYFDNIVKDSNLSPDTVKDKLNWLIINKLATEYKGVDGKVYGLSSKGQRAFSNIISKISNN